MRRMDDSVIKDINGVLFATVCLPDYYLLKCVGDPNRLVLEHLRAAGIDHVTRTWKDQTCDATFFMGPLTHEASDKLKRRAIIDAIRPGLPVEKTRRFIDLSRKRA